MVLKVSPSYIYDTHNKTDLSELFYRDGPFIKNFSLLRHEKCVKYSKLVNNPFKFEIKEQYCMNDFSSIISELFYRDGPFIKKTSCVETRKKC